jgi:hypothetical protein
MNLADLFLRELEKDDGASEVVRKLGKMLAEKHKEALETTAYFAQRQCEVHHKLESLGLDPLDKLVRDRLQAAYQKTTQ